MRNLNFAVIALMSIAFLIRVSNPCCFDSVEVGAQVLHEGGYADLLGKHVGLVTNDSAVVDGTHLVDLLHASGKVRLVALFAPEHGIRGLEEDGVKIGEKKDERTGVPVYSLYGTLKKPTPEMLRGLDLPVRHPGHRHPFLYLHIDHGTCNASGCGGAYPVRGP